MSPAKPNISRCRSWYWATRWIANVWKHCPTLVASLSPIDGVAATCPNTGHGVGGLTTGRTIILGFQITPRTSEQPETSRTVLHPHHRQVHLHKPRRRARDLSQTTLLQLVTKLFFERKRLRHGILLCSRLN